MGAALQTYKGYIHIFVSLDLAILLLRNYPIDILAQVHKDYVYIYMFSRMFIVASDNSGKSAVHVVISEGRGAGWVINGH